MYSFSALPKVIEENFQIIKNPGDLDPYPSMLSKVLFPNQHDLMGLEIGKIGVKLFVSKDTLQLSVKSASIQVSNEKIKANGSRKKHISFIIILTEMLLDANFNLKDLLLISRII